MNELQMFSFESHEVRTVIENGQIWFVGKDVAEVLGYAKSRNAIAAHIDEEDKKDAPIQGLVGGIQSMTIINESGLYSLVLSSKMPDAKKFKRWVTSEVLPTIRQTGSYTIPSYQVSDPIERAQRWIEEQKQMQALQLDNKVKDQQIAELQPKATYYDLILQCSSLLSMTEISKDYGMPAKTMNKKLHELGIQFNQSGMWFLYQKYASYGYTQTKTNNFFKKNGTQDSKLHMYWTQKGRLFIYDTLKSNGILPLIEQDVS